jgi:hypothetical protein
MGMSSRFLLIGLDAADWKVLHPLMDAGHLPTLNRLVEGGASGRLMSTQPAVEALLYTSMVTGKRAWRHGVCHPLEIAADGRGLVPVTAGALRASQLWQMLGQAGRRCLVIGWPATQGSQGGENVIISDGYPQPTAGPGVRPWPPALPGTYWPDSVRERLDGKRVSPEDIGTRVIARYVPKWNEIDRKNDPRLGQLRLFLAADYSFQTAAMEMMRGTAWDFAAVRLPILAPLSRLFLFHHLATPEQRSQEEVQRYGHVLGVGCRILDEMVRQLMELAGPETAVMIASGHGVRTEGMPAGGFRPGEEEAWKTPYGILVAAGPRFARDTLVHGASILDISPTILTWFGLPMGDDMEGRVLVEAFAGAPEIKRVESWDGAGGEAHRGAAGSTGAVEVEAKLAAKMRRETEWNFVQSGLDGGRAEEVLPVLEGLFREFPEQAEVAHALFQSQLGLKHLAAAQATLEVYLDCVPAGIATLLPRAELALAQGQRGLARELAGQVRALKPEHPAALRRLGVLLLRLREWEALGEVAGRAVSLNDQEPVAWLGLAAARLRTGQPAEAVAAARRAIGLQFFLPDAHFVLARGLVALGKWQEAGEAMETLVKIQPGNEVAAAYLRRIPLKDRPTGGGNAMSG